MLTKGSVRISFDMQDDMLVSQIAMPGGSDEAAGFAEWTVNFQLDSA